MRTADVTFEVVDELEADTLLLFIAEDERPLQGLAGIADWRLTGSLSGFLRKGWFKGNEGEKLLSPSRGRVPVERILAIGVGPANEVDVDRIRRAAALAGRALKDAKVTSAACELPRASLPIEKVVEAFRSGFEAEYDGRLTVLGDAHALSSLFND